MNITNTMNSPYKAGYLEIILGPMYASKTTRLVEIYNQCKFCDIPVVAINHDIDSRYDEDETIVTHDKTKIPCLKTNVLKNIWKPETKGITSNHLITKYSKVILINEGQFFEDLFEVVNDMVNHGKQVYVCGLDGDFERKKFGQILDLIPLCDKVTKLTKNYQELEQKKTQVDTQLTNMQSFINQRAARNERILGLRFLNGLPRSVMVKELKLN